VGWAEKQVKYIKSLYDLLSTYILRLEIPRYR
jgi:beta-N-acetylglucosaminidase